MSVVREADEAAKATKMEEFKNETIPFFLEKLDASAGENSGYLALGQVNKIITLPQIFRLLQSNFMLKQCGWKMYH